MSVTGQERAPLAFALRLEHVRGAIVVAVDGEVDIAVADVLKEAACAAVELAPAVVVDLCGCSFIDSSGVAALLKAWRRSQTGDIPFVVACTPEGSCGRVLKLTVHGVFSLCADRTAALAAAGIRTATMN